MCKSKKSTDVMHPNTPKSKKSFKSSYSSSASNCTSSVYNNTTTTTATTRSSSSYNNKNYFKFPFSSSFSRSSSSSNASSSLSTLKDALPENPHVYQFSEICAATNNFLSRRFSSSASSVSWRCTIRGKDAIVFQRKLRRAIELPELRQRLSIICRSHHSSLVRLLGVSMSGNYIYLVYEHVQGASLVNCLRNPKNPNFTILSNWVSRIKIASDLAHGLDYIHHCSGLNSKFVHNHIKSTSVLVNEETMSAKICHFGVADLCGEVSANDESLNSGVSNLTRTSSGEMKIEGTRGYMAPELQGSGVATQKCDVYAFGVVLLELLSGEEALRYVFNEGSGGYNRISVIETAREAVSGRGGVGGGGVRRWVDRRLRDSFPVEVVEKMVAVGLDCAEEDPEKRPEMWRVAAVVSKLYLESVSWAESMSVPTEFSVSMAPR